MDEVKQKMQEIRAEYTRRLDLLRKEQEDLVNSFREKLEERKKEEIMNRLNS